MNGKFRIPFAAALAAACLFLLAIVPAMAQTVEEKRAKIDKMMEETLKFLYAKKPEAEKQIAESAGYGVFDNLGVTVVFFSGAGGKGVVVDKADGKKTYMAMGSGGVGIGLGAEDYRAVFIFKTPETLHSFVDNGWQFGGEAGASGKIEGVGGASKKEQEDFNKNVIIYQITDTGVSFMATLQGTKYWKDSDLN